MTKELHIKCELFCDLQSQEETKEHALERVLDVLNENGIFMSVNRSEIRAVEE